MTTNFEDVGAFHERFDLDNVTRGVGPRAFDPDMLAFRFKFLQEELEEFRQALAMVDHAGMADALVDLVYVVMGTAHVLGYPWQELWEAVQHANMQKIRVTDAASSKRGSSFDVGKPPGWEPPNIGDILRHRGWDV